MYFLLDKLFPPGIIAKIQLPVSTAKQKAKFCQDVLVLVSSIENTSSFPAKLFRKSTLSSADRKLYKPLWRLSVHVLEFHLQKQKEQEHQLVYNTADLDLLNQSFTECSAQTLPHLIALMKDKAVAEYHRHSQLVELKSEIKAKAQHHENWCRKQIKTARQVKRDKEVRLAALQKSLLGSDIDLESAQSSLSELQSTLGELYQCDDDILSNSRKLSKILHQTPSSSSPDLGNLLKELNASLEGMISRYSEGESQGDVSLDEELYEGYYRIANELNPQLPELERKLTELSSKVVNTSFEGVSFSPKQQQGDDKEQENEKKVSNIFCPPTPANTLAPLLNQRGNSAKKYSKPMVLEFGVDETLQDIQE